MLLLPLVIGGFINTPLQPGCTITKDLEYHKLSWYGEGFVKNVSKWFGSSKFSGDDLGMDYSIQVPFTYKEKTYQFGAKIFGIISIEANMSAFVETWTGGGEGSSTGPSYARRFAYFLMKCEKVSKR